MLKRTILITGVLACGWALTGATPGPDTSGIKPIETDLHEFMTYALQPAYRRLRRTIAVDEKDRTTWKAIRGDVLTLAETCNLLLVRVPDEDGEAWVKRATDAREAGAQLYEAVRETNDGKVRGMWPTLLSKCNSCHHQFSEDAPHLRP